MILASGLRICNLQFGFDDLALSPTNLFARLGL
jgi:hypothetical protein